MLVKLLHDTGFNISLPGLPPNVVPLEVAKAFNYYKPHGGRVTMEQFPVTLAYAITDYKCQAKTFDSIISDLHKPSGFGSGFTPSTSAYVQLSRATRLDRVSIMRPFDEKEFSLPLDPELIKELEWQEDMAKATLEMYGWIDR
jgi:hypothetical protein